MFPGSQQVQALRLVAVSDERHKRAYPEGPRHEMTSAWKREVMEAMLKQGISKADLARELDVTRGLITKLFATQQASSLVPRICKLLNVPPPLSPTETKSESDSRVETLLGKMTDEQKAQAIAFLEAFMK